MNCVKCKVEIDARRIKALPHTKVCVNCSTTEAVSCVDITYHKTGNTIQIMDKASADKINKMAKRSGFGIMTGMKGGSGGGSSKVTTLGTSSPKILRMPTQYDYESALKGLGEWIDRGDRELCLKYVTEQYDSRKINSKHCFWLKTVIDKLLPKPAEEKHIEREEVIDEEIQYAFRNWKNSTIYR